MGRTTDPPAKDKVILCPSLGHLIWFSYCRSEQNGAPCPRIVSCWYEHFLVEDFLRQELTPEEWDKFLHPPSGDKISHLLCLIGEAEKAIQSRPTRLQPPSRGRPEA